MTAFISQSQYQENRFLVTGGGGFIGSNIVENLLKNGAGLVRVFDNFSTGFKENLNEFKEHSNLEIIEGDIRDYESCQKAVQNIDCVLHQAALGSVPRSINDPITSHDVNVNGFLNMLNASREAGIKKFVYASSSSVYGDHPDLPKVEGKIGKPLSPYALTKAINEEYAAVFSRTYDFHTIGLRYFNVFGPKQSPKGPYAAVIPLFIEALQENNPPLIHGDGEQTRDFTFVANAIEANLKAAFSNPTQNKVYNVACGEKCSINDLYFALQKHAGSSLEPNYGPERLGDVRNSLADVSAAKEDFNYLGNILFEEGLEKTWQIAQNQKA